MVVDSSIWIEVLQDSKLAEKCQKAMQGKQIHVPTLVLFEVYKKLKDKVSEDIAMEAVATLSQYEVLDLSREVAILAADLSLQYKISMADSIVLAHAHYLEDDLLTLDNDFASLPRTKVIR